MRDEFSTEDLPDLGAIGGMPSQLELSYEKAGNLANGANGHQQAALYGRFWECFEQVAGEALGYCDILEVSSGAYLIGEFEKPTVGVLKENNICGVCSDLDVVRALGGALGGFEEPNFVDVTVVVNQTFTVDMAGLIESSEVSMIIAPGFEAGSLGDLEGVKCVMAKANLGVETLQEMQTVAGGVLLQDRDHKSVNMGKWQRFGKRKATDEEKDALLFAVRVLKHVRSAGMVVANGERTLAVNGGQVTAERASIGVLQGLIESEDLIDGQHSIVCASDRPLNDSEPNFLSEFADMGFRAMITPQCEEEPKMDNRISYFISGKECAKY